MTSSELDVSLTPRPDGGAVISTQPLMRLIYASISQVSGSVLEEMTRIRDHAVARNQADDVRVALLHMSGWFVEWIEGPAPGVRSLLQRVAPDRRHRGLKVIHRSTGSPRLFRPWIGSIVQTREPSDRFAERVADFHDSFARGVIEEPASVWHRLCSPPDARMPATAKGCLRVMLLSSRRGRAFGLLEWLAGTRRRELVRRRFAGAAGAGPDVESDYLDLPDEGDRGLRLVAHARKGLAMGVSHALLPDYPAVVVMLDDDLALSLQIMERLLEACQQVNHFPTIVGLGNRTGVAPEVQKMVECQGMRWIAARSPLQVPEFSDLWTALVPALALID